MAKSKVALAVTIDPEKAMELVASFTRPQRRDFRLELGRLTRLSDLSEEQANFFYGECMVFSQISEDVHGWVRGNFTDKGGTPKNAARLRDLYEFYLALTSDVDIRYDLERLSDGEYDIKDTSIVANDYYIPIRRD